MKHLLNTYTVPPGGWRYVVPETKATLRAGNKEDLTRNVAKHLEANKLPVPHDLGDIIEDQICQFIGPEHCTWGAEEYAAHPTMDGHDVMNGAKVMLGWVLGGTPYVATSEAERRASICSSCVMNMPVGMCMACAGLSKIVTRITAGRRTSYDQFLHSCAICKCSNKAQIWLPLDTLHRGVTPDINEGFPIHCWKKRT